MATLSRTRAVTLIELLVGIGLSSTVLAGLVGVLAAQVTLHRRLEARAAAAQAVRLVLEVLSRDLRRAGFDPGAVGFAPVLGADGAGLLLQSDDDGDGTIDGRSQEATAYVFRPGSGVLQRAVGRQVMPLAEGLTEDGFSLTYLDETGVPIPAAGGIPEADLRRIRHVAVTVSAGDAAGAHLVRAMTAVTLRTPGGPPP